MMSFPTPQELISMTPAKEAFIHSSREIASNIFFKKDPRKILFLGPCSVHEREATLEYARKLRELSQEVKEEFYLIMRVFIEKSRTGMGWKGLLYDPHLDGSHDIEQGVLLSRKLLSEIHEIGLPCAMEFVDPLLTPYIEDLITWGFIGARTSASQPHRQMASSLFFPVGFKNQLDGNIHCVVQAILSAGTPHCYLHLDRQGKIVRKETSGNPFCHLVLRGSDREANFSKSAVQEALSLLARPLIIDCSHGNSRKNPQEQKKPFLSAIEQIEEGNDNILGMMLESFLYTGKQNLQKELQYGVSITDACLGWEETAELIYSSSGVMRSVHS